MNREKIQNISFILLGILAAGIICIVLIEHIIPVFAPFLIAWGVAFAVREPARKLSKKTRVPEGILRVFMAIFATLAVFALLALLLWRIIAAVWNFLSELGEGNAVYDILMELTSPKLPIFGETMPPELAERISAALGEVISSALSTLASAVTDWVSVVPKVLFFLLVTVIALVYFALDLEKINSWVRRLLPERVGGTLSRLRQNFFQIGGKYLRSYLLIMLITFIIMLVGFLLLGVQGAVFVALVVSVLDILPVIGVGTVLVPWSIFELVSGNHAMGIGLLVLFLVNVIARQFAEPKILGKSLDLHPVLTLVFLYAGYALFGIIGLILIPVIAVMVSLIFKEDRSAEVGESDR